MHGELFTWGETQRVWFKGARSSRRAERQQGAPSSAHPCPKIPPPKKQEKPQRSIKCERLGKERGFHLKIIEIQESSKFSRLQLGSHKPTMARIPPFLCQAQEKLSFIN